MTKTSCLTTSIQVIFVASVVVVVGPSQGVDVDQDQDAIAAAASAAASANARVASSFLLLLVLLLLSRSAKQCRSGTTMIKKIQKEEQHNVFNWNQNPMQATGDDCNHFFDERLGIEAKSRTCCSCRECNADDNDDCSAETRATTTTPYK